MGGMGEVLVLFPCPMLLSPVIGTSVVMFRLFAIVGFGLGVMCCCCIAAMTFAYRLFRRIRTRGLALIVLWVGVVVVLVIR